MVAYDAVGGLGAVHVRLDEQLARLLARHHHLDGRAHDARDQTSEVRDSLRWTVSGSSASGDRTQMGIAAGSVHSQTADSAREVRRTARIAAISSFTSE